MHRLFKSKEVYERLCVFQAHLSKNRVLLKFSIVSSEIQDEVQMVLTTSLSYFFIQKYRFILLNMSSGERDIIIFVMLYLINENCTNETSGR